MVSKKLAYLRVCAPRRLERATYCLGGTPVASPGIAKRGLTWVPVAANVAGRSRT
jgi:hypothetical protein